MEIKNKVIKISKESNESGFDEWIVVLRFEKEKKKDVKAFLNKALGGNPLEDWWDGEFLIKDKK